VSRSGDRVAAFVDALVKDRRPKRFPAEPDEAGAMHAAAALRGVRPGVDLPSPEFVEQLEKRLAREAAAGTGGAGGNGLSRRRLLQAAGVSAAAAVAAGVAIDRFAPGAAPSDGSPDSTASRPSQDSLNVTDGQWVPVVATAAIADGEAVRFSAAAVQGFVVNTSGQFDALSAVCTHMGCILKFNATSKSLDCPCHGASFNLEGAPVKSEYLKSLTRIDSRVRDGMVEVQVNKA
jgi:cytochrome b6-f complex iron-sulfur subunit